MQELLLFHLPNCPHCKKARQELARLCAEDPAYAAIPLTLVDESAQKALADRYDYWYVPCFFLGSEKLHEGHAEREDVKRVLDAYLERQARA